MPTKQAYRLGEAPRTTGPDTPLLLSALALVAVGIVMVASSSVAVADGYGVSPWHFLSRHLMFLALGTALAFGFRIFPVSRLDTLHKPMLLLAVVLLLLPFLPGIGHTANGATRWIDLGVSRFQVVEAAKLLVVVYVAGYLARQTDFRRVRFLDTLKPLAVGGMLSVILLKQPDMGSAIVLLCIIGGMVWLAGAAWKHLFVLSAAALPLVGFAAMEPYRLQRIVSFTDPWADPFNTGFQLTQALIAVGRGQVTGVGLGSSVQKLYYLPEAHTDFIFAVLAEELGLLGIVLVMALFAVLIGRIFMIGLKAHRMERPFAGFVAYGIGLWLGIQALVSMGVNLGLLPTKGLTLPLISSGGSSTLMTVLAIGCVLRIKWELDREQLERPRKRREWQV